MQLNTKTSETIAGRPLASSDQPEKNLTGERTCIQKKVLITGCGRSGTRYITFVLRRLGLDVGHETMRKDGIASWCNAGEVNQSPWGVSTHQVIFDQIFHQVRHPLEVISSACTFKDSSWNYICSHIPSCMDEPLLVRSAKYWYYWNIKAETVTDWRYRIEDLSFTFDEFCERLGVPAVRSILVDTPLDVNTRRHDRFIHLYDEPMESLSINSTIVRFGNLCTFLDRSADQ